MINCLWADGDVPTDLLWTSLFQQPLLSKLPGRIVYRPGIHRPAFFGHAVCLFWPITASSTVAGQLSADGRFASFQHVGYLDLCVSYLLQGVNLVSFFSGEVCVVHFCNFDWLVKKVWMLPHPAHLTCVNQSCTSILILVVIVKQITALGRAARNSNPGKVSRKGLS